MAGRFDRFQIKLNSMQAHVELLEMLHSRHTTWITEKNISEIRELHAEIMELIEQLTNKYVALLDLYHKQK